MEEDAMETVLVRASKLVASACAINSTFVQVPSLSPLKIIPDNLFLLRFKAIGLTSEPQLNNFLVTLASLVPDPLSADVMSMPVNSDVQIGLVVNHVEALLLKLDAGGFN
jgi:hypothetical protein